MSEKVPISDIYEISDRCPSHRTADTLTPHSSLLTPHSSLLTPHSSILNSQSLVLNPQKRYSCIDLYLCYFLLPGCNKLYKCGSQKTSKQCTFVAGRLKTVDLLQNLYLRHFYRECSKKQHTHFEDKILRKFAGEDKPQVVTACIALRISTLRD